MGNYSVMTPSFSFSFFRKTTSNSLWSAFLHCEVFPKPSPPASLKEGRGGLAASSVRLLKKSLLMAAVGEHEGAERRADAIYIY